MRMPSEFYKFRRAVENDPIKPSQVLFEDLVSAEPNLKSDDVKIHCFSQSIQSSGCKDNPKLLAYHGEVRRYCCDSDGCRKKAARSIVDEKNRAISLELK